MRLLIDTQVLLWQLEGSWSIPQRVAEAIEAATELRFSVVSFAEIGVKAAIGKLHVPSDLREYVLQSGMRLLGLSADHALAVAELPLHHRDPFDRLLISQARIERLTVVTSDRRFFDYDVSVLAATA